MSEETKEAQEVAELFSTAIEASGVQWCGGGCLALPPEAHRSGVASGQTLHLAAVPTTREELFSALVLIGRTGRGPGRWQGRADRRAAVARGGMGRGEDARRRPRRPARRIGGRADAQAQAAEEVHREEADVTARHVCEAPSGCWRQGVVEVKGRWLCAKHSRAETSPPPEPSLFDEPSSDELRDEAMDRVDRHAEDDWKDAAYRVGRSLSRSRSTFTSEAISGRWRRRG